MDFFNKTADDGSVLPWALYKAPLESIDDGCYINTLEHWIEWTCARGFDHMVQQALARIFHQFCREGAQVGVWQGR